MSSRTRRANDHGSRRVMHCRRGPYIAQTVCRFPSIGVRRHFEDKELVDFTTLIGLINLWNRLAIGFRYLHPVE
jgi:alkylhydroperoxidase family enzyme